MGRIQKHLPFAALAVAALALFVALGTTAIGAGGGGTTKATAGAARAGSLAHVSVLHSATTLTVRGPTRTVAPGTQAIGLRATCPSRYRVTGGGAFSGSSNVGSNINTSEPVSSRTWSVDYNNGTLEPIQVYTAARCIKFG